MKKRSLTVLKLNKKAISKFQHQAVKGGCPSDNCGPTRNWDCRLSRPEAEGCW
ncbi:hypothetical protein [uncultured Kordia sp.]|uniref:hypothetical protein n=1 Tax=uncultured Kordia sp. TaxID=507699 RepID=UPI00260FF2FD|nr:hypothetical protein [uncultured Kordia sp.]